MSGGTTFTGVGGHICAAHRDKHGRMHGHTWEVKVWWQANGVDALALQQRLKGVLVEFDHTELPDELASGEALARAIGNALPGADFVEISRPAEGIFARWLAA